MIHRTPFLEGLKFFLASASQERHKSSNDGKEPDENMNIELIFGAGKPLRSFNCP
jgi:hypothetical protein